MDEAVTQNGKSDGAYHHYNLHIRFLCDSYCAEGRLVDAFTRVERELEDLYNSSILSLHFAEGLDFTVYPFTSSNPYELIEFHAVSAPVYMNEGFASSTPFGEGEFEVVDVDSLLHAAYNEQFIVKMTARVSSRHAKDELMVKDMIRHILHNADVQGVTLCSIQREFAEESVDFALTALLDYLPDNMDTSSAFPIFGFLRQEPEVYGISVEQMADNEINTLWGSEAYTIDSNEYLFKSADPLVPQSSDCIVIGDVSVSIMTTVANDNTTPSCSVVGSDVRAPLWKLSVDDSEGETHHLYTRLLNVPSCSEVSSLLYAARTYPISNIFGDVAGYEYNILASASDIPKLVTLMQNGTSIERNIDIDGKVFFVVAVTEYFEETVDRLDGEMVDTRQAVFKGTETELEQYLQALIDTDEDIISMDTAIAEAVSLGCFID